MDSATLRRCFDLESIGDDRFGAPVAGFPGVDWAYGGLLIGQAGLAARATAPGRDLRSLHLSFVSRTDPGQPVEIVVERLDDRRMFAQRHVRIEQSGQLRVFGSVLLHRIEEGPSHQQAMPSVPGPDEARPGRPGLPVEVRDASVGRFMSAEVAEPTLDIWYRSPDLPTDTATQEAMLAYISDLSLLEAAWRPVPDASIRMVDRVISNTLTHSIWFHQPPRVDDWVLFHGSSPRAHGGRSLCTAHVFDRSGLLMASVAAEALMRLRDPDGS